MYLDRFRYYTAWHDRANRRQYEAPADPWRLVRVAPERLTRWHSDRRLHWGLGRVQGGDWDRAADVEPLSEVPQYRGLVQRFEEGRDWADTALFEWVRERFADRGTHRGYDSPEAYLEDRCAYVDDLFRRVESEGYRPNAKATHDNPLADGNAFEDAWAHHLEPLVVIGRDGAVQLSEGIHRVAIASILDLPSIPVQVLCRHVEWQRVRDRVATAEDDVPPDCAEYRDHPDLADLV